MIIVQLLGGMGNQMFQYAMGRALSLANQSELKLDTSILLDHRPGMHAVNRNFDLDVFKLEAAQATTSERWTYNWHGLGPVSKAAARIRSLIAGNEMTREKYFHFDPDILALKGNLYLAGLWQSYKYFESIADVIRSDFRLRNELAGSAAELAKTISGSPSVCINVRRSDFVSVGGTRQSLGFVGTDYYRQAVSALRERHQDLRFFVFSDEVDWCRANLDFLGSDAAFVDHQYAGPKFVHYLELMRSCRHFVIPNSTFAWWAAWLNEHPDKTVIAPKNWFAHDQNDTSDLIPNEWTRM